MSRLALSCALLALTAACKKEPERPRRTEPWLASPSASSSAAANPTGVLELTFSAESSIHFSVPGRAAKPSGQVPVSGGKLRLDLGDLKRTTANIDADLTRLVMDPDSLPSNANMPTGSPSSLALNWLELGPDVLPEKREQFGRARFELSSLENLSATTFDPGAKRPNKVRATAVGTLLVHGYRAPVRAEVSLEALPPGPTGQQALSIRTTGPLVLPLAPHEITARGPAGVLDPQQAVRAEASVGKNARIELALVAHPVTHP